MSPRLTSPRSWSLVELITETEYCRPAYYRQPVEAPEMDGLRVLSSSTILKTMWFFCLFPSSKRHSSIRHYQPLKASPKRCQPLSMSTLSRESFHGASESWKTAGSDSSSSDESSCDYKCDNPTIK